MQRRGGCKEGGDDLPPRGENRAGQPDAQGSRVPGRPSCCISDPLVKGKVAQQARLV